MNIKGKVTMNGHQVEIEAGSAQEIAAILTSVLGNQKGVSFSARTQKSRTPRTPEEVRAYKREWYRNKMAGTNFIARPGSVGKKKGYQPWTPGDILTVAKLAAAHGSDSTGFNNRAYHTLREKGEVQTRRRNNVYGYVSQIHNFVWTGKTTTKMPESLLSLLSENGFKGPMVERLPQLA